MDKTVYTALLLFFVLVAAPVPSSRAADATVQAQNAQTADKLKKEKPAAGKMQKAPAASSARQLPVKKQKNSLHARDWTFSEGSSRDAWQIQGMPTNNLQGRAVGSPVPKDITPGQVVNTSKGIDSALSQAEKSKKKGALALSVDDESSPWRESATSDKTPDENLSMESRHVVRAYADTEVSEDMNIGLGPELILRNEHRERPSNNKQPDSVLGMGMQFKLDF
ncbi:hypothetical protein [Desulfovibrio sp.]|uniref:hypothetical protein n=1 Tax=Desulfovibrio sp. TaxID=885 RepID=UPI003D128354